MLIAALLGVALSQALTEPSLSAGRFFAKQLAAGHVDAAWRARSARVKDTPAERRKVQQLSERVRAFGPETRLIAEGLAEDHGRWVYRRLSAVEFYARGLELVLVLDDRGRLIEGSAAQPSREAPTTRGTYRVKNRLTAPVEGRWNVLWGGRTWDENRHASVPDMRYALDLLVRGEDGHSYRGRGEENEEYLAWNRPVVAAGDGVVVVAQDGFPDTPPNRPRLGSIYGNYVVVDHGQGEYSLYGHLKRGSLRVRPGDTVRAGDRLARVGSSGLSTEPHLHFQLMDAADYLEAQGLPVQLVDLEVNGRKVERVELRRGDVFGPVSFEARRDAEVPRGR
ncbi:MAG: M23 family metallopeptidase [Myxococcota bacterium]